MKKRLIGLLSVLCIFLTAGCGSSKEQVINCTLETTASNYTLDATYTIYGKDNIVTKVKTQEIVTSSSDDVLDYFEEYLNDTYTEFNDGYSGYNFKVTKENDKVVSDVTIDYNIMDMDKYVEDYQVMKSYVNNKNQLTVDNAKKIYESMNATCE